MVVRGTIRTDHSIGAEGIIITYPVGMTKVAAHSQPIHIFDRVVDNKTLVHPIPDASALELLVVLKHIPIVLQTTHAITHGVAVFHHDKWTVQTVQMLIHETL